MCLLFLTGGLITESLLLDPEQGIRVIKAFERKLQQQQVLLDQKLQQICSTLAEKEFEGDFQSVLHPHSALFHKKGLGFLVDDGQRLLYWSDNRFAFEAAFRQKGRLLFLPNGIYFRERRRQGPYTVSGLILLKEKYQIQNEYLSDQFADPFDTPDSYRIQPDPSDDSLPVRSTDGSYLFSMVPDGKIFCEKGKLFLPLLLYAGALLCFLLFIRIHFRTRYRREPYLLRSLASGLILFGVYWVHILFRVPAVCYAFELFSPTLYACSFVLPSLGDLILLAVLIFFWSFQLTEELRFSAKGNRHFYWTAVALTAGFYLFVNTLIQNLVRNSSFSFYLNRLDDISLYSMLGYLIIALLLFSASRINLKIAESSRLFLSRKRWLHTHALLLAFFAGLA
ncbi:MAG: hypothetical protein AB7D05_08925, partial [Mangrovibacterium sp.]